ncbi:class I SAM-dependent methyltransferase [Actinokineospora auranticolor]|uniref:class I SAM-dependent methyltransferase n=1 Tax=Actinokineospora auranticolor TaxID=155976 RepID=UPI001FEA1CB8|nr:class I SAM-dependent methyltransferase [Actinokineospora auranticolor]
MATQNPPPAFDLIGRRYDESFVERDVQIAEAAWLVERLPAGSRVLDLGCGSGLPTAKQLLDAGLSVVGIDESEVMLELAREQAPGGDYRHGDLRELTGLGEFDAAVAFFALLMLSKADIELTLRAIRAQLRGPKLLLLSMVQGDFDTFPVNFLGAPTTVSAYPPDQLKQVVADAGFGSVELREFEAEAEPGRIEAQLYLRAVAE